MEFKANSKSSTYHLSVDDSVTEPIDVTGAIQADRSTYEFNQLAASWPGSRLAFESFHFNFAIRRIHWQKLCNLRNRIFILQKTIQLDPGQ